VKYLRSFVHFWYSFIIGDDWLIAAGVVVGLGFTAFMVHIVQLQAWWLLPVVIVTMLTLSLWLATRRQV
jgi:hypothetical protein